ncbi:winged helix-turn-helix transcriptional regulator [Oceanobacter mangrovi]|uniref:winged helix-turn-helix transcriptional regulator n=1 Tax=Oceanobacter mangrovi TaxID=2862510 RepID=UPI001C8E55D3|nr:winged helix-turn-helix transcriptional regulator [Oceanobacter mangrovi]
MALINREVHEGNVITVVYSLTPLGQSLEPLIDALYQWSERHLKSEQARWNSTH